MPYLKKSYKVMVFSSTTGKSFNLEISSLIIKSISIILLVIFTSSGFLAYQYFKNKSYKKTLKQISKENTTLKTQVTSFNTELDKLKDHVNKINSLGTKLRVMAGLEQQKTNTLNGVGGPSFEEVNNFVSPNSFEDDNIKKLHYVIDKINYELKHEEANIKELFKYYKDKNIKLSSTPSIWPSNGWVTSPFGFRKDPFTGQRRFHEGLDISNRIGTQILAPADGVVTFSGNDSGYGLSIEISHGYGISTKYAHLYKMFVKVGDEVQRGDVIAEMGNTGRSTGPHLHYEVKVKGKNIDPMNFILD